MPMNIIKINNVKEFEVPDSWMKPLVEYLELVKYKINNNMWNSKPGMFKAVVNKEDGKWVIDEDSYHLFEEDGGNYSIQEITISQIRSLIPDKDGNPI